MFVLVLTTVFNNHFVELTTVSGNENVFVVVTYYFCMQRAAHYEWKCTIVAIPYI